MTAVKEKMFCLSHFVFCFDVPHPTYVLVPSTSYTPTTNVPARSSTPSFFVLRGSLWSFAAYLTGVVLASSDGIGSKRP